ncbi:MAG: hypothetical protein V5A76_05500 [Candidatus Thermoplasmatota archaeon]
MDKRYNSILSEKRKATINGGKKKIKLYNELLKELLGKEGWEQVSEFKDSGRIVYGFEKGKDLKGGNTLLYKFLKEKEGVKSIKEVKRIYFYGLDTVKLLTDSGSFNVKLESVLTYYSKKVIKVL